LSPNNAINTDSKKRRAFVAPLFTAGYGERYTPLGLNLPIQRKKRKEEVLFLPFLPFFPSFPPFH